MAYVSHWGSGWYNWSGNATDSQVLKCCGCKKYFIEEDMFPAVMLDKSTKFYCPDCMADSVSWCIHCGSAYQKYSPEAPDTGLCPVCADMERKELNDKSTNNKK